MGIRKISIGVTAIVLLGANAAMAASPVMPSATNVVIAPVAVASLTTGARVGARQNAHKSDVAGGGLVLGILAAAAVTGGVLAATDNGNSHSSSP